MKAVYVKFMTREELISMLTEIHRFSIITKEGKTLTVDKRVDKPVYEKMPSGVTICWHATAFKLSAFDYEDVLITGEGYVRYSTFQYGKKENAQGTILRERYGFTRED